MLIGNYHGYSIYADGIWIKIKKDGKTILQMRKSSGQNPYTEIEHMIAVKMQPSARAQMTQTKEELAFKETVFAKPKKRKVRRLRPK